MDSAAEAKDCCNRAASRAAADNSYLLKWEADGLNDDGIDAWKAYAQRVKRQQRAAMVFWVSQATGKYFSDAGLVRQVSDKDQWFHGFLAGGKPYTLDIDREGPSSPYMLFTNVRVQGDGGKLGVAGLGLAVDALAEGIRSYKIGHSGSAYLAASLRRRSSPSSTPMWSPRCRRPSCSDR